MYEEHGKLDIELRFKNDHITISSATGFADQTEQGNNVVLFKVRPLIDGFNPFRWYMSFAAFEENPRRTNICLDVTSIIFIYNIN